MTDTLGLPKGRELDNQTMSDGLPKGRELDNQTMSDGLPKGRELDNQTMSDGLPKGRELDNQDLLRELSGDRALAGVMLFSHRHRDETPGFHVQVHDLWRCADDLVVIEAFRGGAKTTLSEEFLLLEAAFGNFRYCLLFGETYTKACQRIEAMKHEVRTNAKLRWLFGRLEGKPWNENQLALSNGALIEAHGWEEEIRGYKHLDARPDRAHLDDIESKESVRDTATVDKGWEKLNGELIPALDKDRRKVRLTGTPLADDTLLSRAAASGDWTVGKFPLVTAPGCVGNEALDHPAARATWVARHPLAWCKAERDRYERAGLLRVFVQEYQLIAAQTQGKPFVEGDIRFEEVAPITYAPRVLVIDPARTTDAKKSDRTGRVVASRVGTTVYVHESSGEFWKPDQIVADCFDTSFRHDDAEVAIERNSLDEWLMQPIRSEMYRRSYSLAVSAILAPSDRSKEAFIMGLQPLFKAGDIVLVGGKGKHQQLVQEIVNFPAGRRDILNALAYVQRVFGGDAVYPEFGADNIAHTHNVDEQSVLCVSIHATATHTCGVVLEVNGRHLTVLHDFASPLQSEDAVRDILKLVGAAYPGRKVGVWVPADDYDQQGRVALVEALKLARVPIARGSHISSSRGCLAEHLRTSVAGLRCLRVLRTCRATLRALATGYHKPIGRDGRTAGEPTPNQSRVLMEALETLVHGIDTGGVFNELPAGFGASQNPQGVGYLSALRR